AAPPCGRVGTIASPCWLSGQTQQWGLPMKTIASFALFAALLTSPATFAQAPGPTGGGSNTAPTSGAFDSGTIDRPGTGTSTINPGSAQQSPASPPVTTGVAPSNVQS